VGVIKEFIDDMFRYNKDKELNNKRVTIVRNGALKDISSQQLHVGDIVYLREEEQVRADMVIIKSSNVLKSEKNQTSSGISNSELLSNLTSGGIVWVETSALDGESHYKERKSVAAAQNLFQNDSSKQDSDLHVLNQTQFIIECTQPNAELDQFRGDILICNQNNISSRFPLTSHNLLLQGTTLKSTTSAFAIVVYTGNETKIGMNKRQAEMKWTKMDNFINNIVVGIFILQFLIGITFGLIGNYNGSAIPYFSQRSLQEQHSSLLKNFFHTLVNIMLPYIVIPVRFTLLCSLMIPQSLKITSDITKYMISILFIGKDCGLSDKNGNMPLASNTSIAEELGQVNYIFSDKTGTLTENLLTLCKVLVNGEIVDVPTLPKYAMAHNTISMDFLRTLAICHTVYCDEVTETNVSPHYRSSSPEEDAFVKFASSQGVSLHYRDEERILIKINSESSCTLEEYRIVKILYFNSDRRRMSVIVKRESDSQYFLYCKGADDVISERVASTEGNILQHTLSLLSNLASQEGLRVMMMAGKSLSIDDVTQFLEQSSEADENQEQELYDLVENNLNIYGASAMEDKLQEGAAECIDSLREAGITVWMLTGDKTETAVQISQACHLIPSLPKDRLNIFYIRGDSSKSVHESLVSCLSGIKDCDINTFKCMVLEGRILRYILDEENNTSHNLDLFLELCRLSNSCICCRMTPKMKGKIVRIVKYPITNGSQGRLQNYGTPICLAIGDGGNDVNMILEADVGVGISTTAKVDDESHEEFDVESSENLQAIRASDFGIPKFNALKRLLLVHGRNSYKRLALVSQYTMYKSVVLAACQLVFNAFFTMFSGSAILRSRSLVFYNILYTSTLPFVFSMGHTRIGELFQYIVQTMYGKSAKVSQHEGHSFEVSDLALEKIPELYRESQKGVSLTKNSLLLWFLNGIYQGFVILMIVSRTGKLNGGCATLSSSTLFADDLTNNVIMFVLVVVQWLTVLMIHDSHTVNMKLNKIRSGLKSSTMSLSQQFYRIRVSTFIMLFSIVSFVMVNVLSFSNPEAEQNIFWRIMFILGDEPCLYWTSLLAVVLCILPLSIVTCGMKDGGMLLLFNSLKKKMNFGHVQIDESFGLSPSDYLLITQNTSAFIRQRETDFYQKLKSVDDHADTNMEDFSIFHH